MRIWIESFLDSLAKTCGESRREKTHTKHSKAFTKASITRCNLLQYLVAFKVAFEERTVDLLLQELLYLREGSNDMHKGIVLLCWRNIREKRTQRVWRVGF